MLGWEGFIGIFEGYRGWGSTIRNLYGRQLWVESDGLNVNPNFKERDDKIVWGRFSSPSSRSYQYSSPNGPVTFQPRAEETMLTLMSHFQAVHIHWATNNSAIGTPDGGIGTATFTFVPININPNWVGSNWGSVYKYAGTGNNVFPIILYRLYGTSDSVNTIKFEDGIADSLEIVQEFGEDLKFTPTYKFYDATTLVMDIFNLAAYAQRATTLGFQDWQGTFTFEYEGTAYDLELTKYQCISNQGLSERGKIGARHLTRFPFAGRPKIYVNLDIELTDPFPLTAQAQTEGTAFAEMLWYTSKVNWLRIWHPLLKVDPHEVPIPGGEGEVTLTLPLRAYSSEDMGTAPMIVELCCVFATKYTTLYEPYD